MIVFKLKMYLIFYEKYIQNDGSLSVSGSCPHISRVGKFYFYFGIGVQKFSTGVDHCMVSVKPSLLLISPRTMALNAMTVEHQ